MPDFYRINHVVVDIEEIVAVAGATSSGVMVALRGGGTLTISAQGNAAASALVAKIEALIITKRGGITNLP